jgi:hypothetical protein
MKRLLYILFIGFTIIIFNGNAKAQSDKGSTMDTIINNDNDFLKSFEVEDVDTFAPKKFYKVLGFGYTGTFIMHKLGDFNTLIKDNNFNMPELKTPIYLSGFNANFSVEQTRNFNIGFSYSAGSKNVEKSLSSDINPMLKDYTRNINYKVSFTSIDLNYAIVPFESFAIMPGVSFGLSNLALKVYQSKSNYDFKRDLKDSNSFNYSLDGSFYFAEPHVNLQYKLSQNFCFRAGAGYSFAFSPDWKYNNDGTLSNMPSGVKPEGLNINFGIYFGFFDF